MKSLILRFIRSLGYDLVNTKSQFWYDKFPYDDVKMLLDRLSIHNPIMFDVGANHGQTIDILTNYFPTGIIHAFEPGRTAFKTISNKFSSNNNIILNHVAASSVNGTASFFDYTKSDLSSLNKLIDSNADSMMSQQYEVETIKLDSYCQNQDIKKIHLFKTDTQGHEMDVFEGFDRTLRSNQIFLAFVEINFQQQYENEESYLSILEKMHQYGFDLFRLYHARYDANGKIMWADGLFVNETFLA
ncbi:MAG: FkbM family methyltransferase [Flavobacteriales bacterium]|nr:FkbM family methyltransferase [Flavobacteriales bacterium]